MVHTQEDLEYIEYYLWKHGAHKSVRQLAQELGVGQEVIYRIAKMYNIPVQVRNAASIEACEGRPYTCFDCKMRDCLFGGNCTDEELAYLYQGISKATDRNRKRSSKRGKAKR